MKTINKNALFTTGCLSPLVTSIPFGYPAGRLNLSRFHYYPEAGRLRTI